MAKKPANAKTVRWGCFVLTEAEIERQIAPPKGRAAGIAKRLPPRTPDRAGTGQGLTALSVTNG